MDPLGDLDAWKKSKKSDDGWEPGSTYFSNVPSSSPKRRSKFFNPPRVVERPHRYGQPGTADSSMSSTSISHSSENSRSTISNSEDRWAKYKKKQNYELEEFNTEEPHIVNPTENILTSNHHVPSGNTNYNYNSEITERDHFHASARVDVNSSSAGRREFTRENRWDKYKCQKESPSYEELNPSYHADDFVACGQGQSRYDSFSESAHYEQLSKLFTTNDVQLPTVIPTPNKVPFIRREKEMSDQPRVSMFARKFSPEHDRTLEEIDRFSKNQKKQEKYRQQNRQTNGQSRDDFLQRKRESKAKDDEHVKTMKLLMQNLQNRGKREEPSGSSGITSPLPQSEHKLTVTTVTLPAEREIVPYKQRIAEMRLRHVSPVSAIKIDDHVRSHVDYVPLESTNPRKLSVDEAVARNAYEMLKYKEISHLSLIGQAHVHPMSIINRSEDTFLRPIVIDALGLAYKYKPSFGARWVLSQDHFIAEKILPMEPIVKVCLYFLALGHKVIIVVPEYYRNVVYFGSKDKVDNLIAWDTLDDLGIIEYLEDPVAEMWQNNLSIFVMNIDGCLISSADSKRQADKNDGRQFPYKYNVDEEGYITIPPSERIVTPEFIGPTKFINLCFEFSFRLHKPEHKLRESLYKQHVKLVQGKNNTKYVHVERYAVLNYCGDCHLDPSMQFLQQIERKDQVKQISALKDLYPLNANLVRGCQTVILTHNMIEKRWKNGEIQSTSSSAVRQIIPQFDLLTDREVPC